MPSRPLRACSSPGCADTSGRCPTHRRERDALRRRERGTTAERGYGSRWQRYRRWWLTRYALCGDRADGSVSPHSRCRQAGRGVHATEVDHIVPVTGPDDPTFWQPSAHQSLCRRCHRTKTQQEQHR